MIIRIKYLIIIILINLFALGLPLDSLSQNKNQLAFQYYRNNEFDKAATLFKELYKERKSYYYRTYYIQSLIKNEQLEEAENFVNKELRGNKNNLGLRIDQAYIWEKQGKKAKAKNEYEDIIDDYANSKQTINKLTNNFMSKAKYELAEKTYKKGKDILGVESYYYKLANLYSVQRKYPEMTKAYLDLLKKNDGYLKRVQSKLQNVAARDIQGNFSSVLEKKLIKRIQNSPEKLVYSELLIWQYIQTGKYELAVNQAIALDNRKNEGGERLYRLAKLAYDNGKPEIASKCLNQIYDKGKSYPFYFPSKKIELNYRYKDITRRVSPAKEDLKSLEKELIKTRKEAPRKLSYSFTSLLAKLQAFYLDKNEEAVKQIDSLMNTKRLDNDQNAEIRILRGDILMASGNPWEASLIYAKVEQDNKNNPIGYEAKFKKAKLAYYTGQFEWARSQLDVLKASTSKLIANDAFELSLFIKENIVKDSLEKEMNQFARADMAIFKRNYDLALKVLDSIKNNYPTGKLTDDVLYRKAGVFKMQGKYTKAVDFYNQVVTDHGWQILADNSLIKMARIQENKLNDEKAAMESYKQLLLNYKGSIFTSEARQAVRKLRGDKAASDD